MLPTGRQRQASKREAGGVPFGIPPASEEGRYSKESRERLKLFLFASATRSAALASGRLLLAIRTRRDYATSIARRRSRTLRHDPQLDLQVRQAARIGRHQSAGIDAARVDEIILRTVRARQTLGIAAAVADDVTLSGRLVLQLDREVVESGLLIVEADVAILVELTSRVWRRLDREAARRSPVTRRIHATDFDCRGNR